MTWEDVDHNWGDIIEALRDKLPVNECVDFAGDGQLVTANRPMIESIIDARRHREEQLFIYMRAAGILKTRRVISIGVGTPMRLGVGGRAEK